MYDICLIGADILGAFLAHRLAHKTLRVLWLEASDDVACHDAASRIGRLPMVPRFSDDHFKTRLIQQGLTRYRTICQEFFVSLQYRDTSIHIDFRALALALAEEAVLNHVDLHLSQKIQSIQRLQNATFYQIHTASDVWRARLVINTVSHPFPTSFTEACFPPINETNDFIVKKTATVPGLFQIGVSSDLGLVCAPALADHVADTLLHGLISAEAKPTFQRRRPPLRLHDMLPVERDCYVHAHPEAGRILCRCCQITEAEILDVIRRPVGAKDFESVARRLGVGSGICGGGRCRIKIETLLERELSCEK